MIPPSPQLLPQRKRRKEHVRQRNVTHPHTSSHCPLQTLRLRRSLRRRTRVLPSTLIPLCTHPFSIRHPPSNQTNTYSEAQRTSLLNNTPYLLLSPVCATPTRTPSCAASPPSRAQKNCTTLDSSAMSPSPTRIHHRLELAHHLKWSRGP